MNNNSFSILAVASRFGKLIGALLSIIGYFIFTGTLTGLINDFASGSFSSMGSSQITDIVAEQIQLMSDVLGLIRAGADSALHLRNGGCPLQPAWQGTVSWLPSWTAASRYSPSS